jgi:hypothetical protein
MKPYETADVLRKKPLLVVRLKDVFASPTTPRMRHLPIGQKMVTILPNKLPVVVEHRTDGSWALVIPNIGTWPLIAQEMPVPKRRMIRKNGVHHLPFGLHQPVRFMILDATGRKVRCLYMDQDERVGSAHEIGAAAYDTDHMTSSERTMRHQDRVRQAFPLQGDDMLNPNIKIRRVLARRPFYKHRTKFLEQIIRARHGIVHKGDRIPLQEEVTMAINEYLWTRRRRHLRASDHPTYATTLKPFNEARWLDQLGRRIEQEEPGVGNRRFID